MKTEDAMVVADNLGLLAPGCFENTWRVAQVFAESALVPEYYRGKTGDCMLVLDLANRMAVAPFMLFQNMAMVKGRPCLEGKLVIALVNDRGPFARALDFELSGEGATRACECVGTYSDGREARMRIDMALAEAEGWTKQNAKWRTMTDQMLRYRSASWLARVYCPGVLMGLYSEDEAREIIDVQAVVTTMPTPRADGDEALAAGRRRRKAPGGTGTGETETGGTGETSGTSETETGGTGEISGTSETETGGTPQALGEVLRAAGVDPAKAGDYCRSLGWLKRATAGVDELGEAHDKRVRGNVTGFATSMANWLEEQKRK